MTSKLYVYNFLLNECGSTDSLVCAFTSKEKTSRKEVSCD